MEKRLLIVDDSQEIVDIVSEILSDLFDVVESARSVEAAERLLSENVYSFIVLDINLEGRNGAEVIKFLISSPKNANNSSPFVIVSGIISPQFIERNKTRFAGILLKPFEHEDLRKLAEDILGGKTPEVSSPPETLSSDDIPYLKCALPFPIIQLEQRVNKILDQVKKSPKLKQLFSQMMVNRNTDKYIETHIGMLVNVSTAISIQMEWNTDKTLEKFVYAAYLHDLALANRPDLARIHSFEALENEKEKISEYDYKLVFEHPNIAARSIEGMVEIPSDVAIIIRQHHELPKETGYPTKCGYQKIVPLAVVFIIAQDLVEFILANPKWTMDDYIKKSRSKFKGSHFSKILHMLSDI